MKLIQKTRNSFKGILKQDKCNPCMGAGCHLCNYTGQINY